MADTGIGMTQDVAARAFEPFFTTKPRDQGTGLGLATAYGIVKAAGGHIELDSEPGTGTVVTAYFPLTERRAAPADSESGEERPSRPGATVMVVENEDAVRKLTQRILSRNGYAVVSAEGPAEALRHGSAAERASI